LSTWSPQKSI